MPLASAALTVVGEADCANLRRRRAAAKGARGIFRDGLAAGVGDASGRSHEAEGATRKDVPRAWRRLVIISYLALDGDVGKLQRHVAQNNVLVELEERRAVGQRPKAVGRREGSLRRLTNTRAQPLERTTSSRSGCRCAWG